MGGGVLRNMEMMERSRDITASNTTLQSHIGKKTKNPNGVTETERGDNTRLVRFATAK